MTSFASRCFYILPYNYLLISYLLFIALVYILRIAKNKMKRLWQLHRSAVEYLYKSLADNYKCNTLHRPNLCLVVVSFSCVRSESWSHTEQVVLTTCNWFCCNLTPGYVCLSSYLSNYLYLSSIDLDI